MAYKTDIACVYGIYCRGNAKLYIGSSITAKHRIAIHKSLLRKNKHFNTYLQRAWNKYGEESFEFTLIEKVDQEEILDKEKWYIETLNTLIPSGFNIAKDTLAPMMGRSHTEESKEKMSLGRVGEKNGMYGRKRTKEEKEKMSVGQKAAYTKQRRQEISERAKKRTGSKNGFFEKEHSETTKVKIARARATLSDDEVRKIRYMRFEQKMSNAAIAKAVGVGKYIVQGIVTGKTYKYVDDKEE